MSTDEKTQPRKSNASKVWSGIAGVSFLVAILALPIAAIVTVAVVWFAPIWDVSDQRRATIGKIVITAICAALLYPAATRIYQTYQASSLTCSNAEVTALGAQIIEEKILLGTMPDADPKFTAIRTVPGADILTCRSLVQYKAGSTTLEQNVLYTVEMTDDGQQFYVQVRFE